VTSSVVIDIGAGRYVMMAHLQPGCIRVRVGDTTHVGQRIGSVGNSGNTSEPHPQNQVQNRPTVDRTELTDSSPDGFGFGVAVSAECNAQSVDAGLIITGPPLTLKRNWGRRPKVLFEPAAAPVVEGHSSRLNRDRAS
jgi:pyruvate/2-oxoglutarate dehydrogenase complex dihydrolipoamide acyltransferase (E2) component